jgi:hypothetical protein
MGDSRTRANRPKLSKRVYLGVIGADALPEDFWDWHFVERYNWTLDEARRLSLADFSNYLSVMDGKAKAKQWQKK